MGSLLKNAKLLGSFLMLMRQKSQWRMPHWTHESGAVKMQEDLFGPCRQRAVETHDGFEPFKKWTATDVLKGYYQVLDDNEGIACTLLLPPRYGDRHLQGGRGLGLSRQQPVRPRF